MKDSKPTNCPGPVERRSFLQAGVLGFGGLALSDLLRGRASAQEAPKKARRDTSVILVWLPGGPSHLETFDMKPEAPPEVRGVFKPIKTDVPGIEICEYMPLLAKCAKKYTLIRSVAHEFADHGGGHKRFLTARAPLEPTGFVNDYPAVGSVVAKMREDRQVGLPNYISGTPRGDADTFSFGAAYLGPAYTPFDFKGDPSDSKFEIKNLALSPQMSDRLDDRLTLLGSMDRIRRRVDASGTMDAMDRFQQRAVELMTSPKAREAFDLSREPEKLRERYGRHAWGQRALMARRLVEAGCSFVTMVMENPYQSGLQSLKNGVYNWDSHAVNCHLFDDTRFRLPIFDRAVSALVEDVHDRGLDKDVMVVVTGEFGRTPRLTEQVGSQTGVMQPGRDHWPNAMSILVTGGGMRTGQVVGSTNALGEHPQDRPLTPNDLWATVYHHLGIDPETAFPDPSGRPMPILPFGAPIPELI